VDPTPSQWYTPSEAVAAFGSQATSEFFCERQFVVLPNVVLCLFTLGDSATESQVSSPSQVVWKPRRLDYLLGDQYPWLPTPVREVYDRTQKPIKKIREHHLLLRLPADERFFYVGKAHLGSYGGPLTGGTAAGYSATFYLNTRLPREVWLRFGGYSGWLIEINHDSHRIDLGDLQAFRQLAEELPRQEFSHLCMTRYEEDSLTVHTNDQRGWLMYLREPGDGGLYTHDQEFTGDPEMLEVFRCGCGIALEFPARQTLPRHMAIDVAEAFFKTGQLPSSVPWEDG
jgi:hypothetical protein